MVDGYSGNRFNGHYIPTKQALFNIHLRIADMKPSVASPNPNHETLAAISDSNSGKLNKAKSVDELFEKAKIKGPK